MTLSVSKIATTACSGTLQTGEHFPSGLDQQLSKFRRSAEKR
jgi:hypothetical protein